MTTPLRHDPVDVLAELHDTYVWDVNAAAAEGRDDLVRDLADDYFERSVRLVGKANVVRIGLIYGGLVLICFAVVSLVAVGILAVIALYARALNVDVTQVLSGGWTIFGVTAFSVLIAMSALLAYVSAVQTLVYLDLRMRREGLDLAMRFDCVAIPQPSAPPGRAWVPG